MTTTATLTVKARNDTDVAFRKVSANLKKLAALGAIAGTAMAAVTKKTLDSADALQKIGIRLGISTEALSRYKHVAELSGVTFETLTMGWQRMTRRVSEAANGFGEAKGALAELNLDATELNKLQPDKQFEVLADALHGVINPADKVRLAMKLFDSEGVSLLQTMSKGSVGLREMTAEADRLGLTISQEMADGAAKANDAFTRLSGALRGGATQAILQYTDEIAGLADFLRISIPVAVDTAVIAFNTMKLGFQTIAAGIATTLALLLRSLEGIPLIGEKFAGASETMFEAAASMGREMAETSGKINDSVAHIKELTTATDEFSSASIGAAGNLDSGLTPAIVTVGGAVDETKEKIDKATDSINGLYDRMKRGSGGETVLTEIVVTAKKTGEELDDVADKNDSVVETMRSGWERFKDSSTDSVAGFIRTGKLDLNSFKNFTLDILSQIAAKILTTFAFDKLGIGGGSGGGMFSGLSGLFGGDGAGGGIAKIFGKGGSIATMAGKVGTSISGGIGSMAASLGAAAPYAMAALAAGALLSKLFGGGRSAEEIFGDELKEVQATKASGAFSAAALGGGLTLEGGGANVGFLSGSADQLNEFASYVQTTFAGIETTVQDGYLRIIGTSGSGTQTLVDQWLTAGGGISESMAGMSDNSIKVLEALREYGDRTGIELTEGFKEFALSGNASIEELSTGGIDSIEKLLDYWNNQEFVSKTGVFEIQTIGSSPSYAEALPPEYSVGTPLVTKTGGAIVHEGERILTKEQNKTYNNGGASDKAIYDLIDAIMMNQEARRV